MKRQFLIHIVPIVVILIVAAFVFLPFPQPNTKVIAATAACTPAPAGPYTECEGGNPTYCLSHGGVKGFIARVVPCTDGTYQCTDTGTACNTTNPGVGNSCGANGNGGSTGTCKTNCGKGETGSTGGVCGTKLTCCTPGSGNPAACQPACSGATPICDSATSKCVASNPCSTTCAGATPVCNMATGQCVSSGAAPGSSTASTLTFSSATIAFDDTNISTSVDLTVTNSGTTPVSWTETTTYPGNLNGKPQWLGLPTNDDDATGTISFSGNGRTQNLPAKGSAIFTFTVNGNTTYTAGAYPNAKLTFNIVGGSSQTVDATLNLKVDVKVAADMGFRIDGVSPASVANANKTATVTIDRMNAENFLASSNSSPTDILGASSYTATGTFTYDPVTHAFLNHNMDLGTLPSGNYILAMHVDGNLDEQVTQNSGTITVLKLTPGRKIKTDIVNVIPGDVAPGQGDNFIDIIDFNKMVDCKDKPIAGACKNEDLNDDGKIDQGDIDLLMLHFGSLGYSLQKPGFSCVIDPACQNGQQSLQLCTLVCTRQQ